jgi:hypothetical protein
MFMARWSLVTGHGPKLVAADSTGKAERSNVNRRPLDEASRVLLRSPRSATRSARALACYRRT